MKCVCILNSPWPARFGLLHSAGADPVQLLIQTIDCRSRHVLLAATRFTSPHVHLPKIIENWSIRLRCVQVGQILPAHWSEPQTEIWRHIQKKYVRRLSRAEGASWDGGLLCENVNLAWLEIINWTRFDVLRSGERWWCVFLFLTPSFKSKTTVC